MRKILYAFIFTVMLSGCSANSSKESAQLPFIDKNLPITRGQAVKMLALSRYTPDEINALPRTVALDDSDVSNIYDKYINAATAAGLISGTQENTFLAGENLTLEQANFILKNAAGGKNLVLQYSQQDRKKPISLDVWLQAFDAIDDKAEEKEIVILADNSLCTDLSENYVLSSEGLLNREGIDIPPEYIGCGIKALLRGNSILALKDITTDTPVIKNAEVMDILDNGIIFNINGCHIFYACAPETLAASMGDKLNIKVSDGRVISLAA